MSGEMMLPKELEDTVEHLLVQIPPHLVEDIKHVKQDDICSVIDSRAIRNEFGLWGDSELPTWFKSQGIGHADDMSEVICKELWCRCVGEGHVVMEDEVEKYAEYWKKQSEGMKATHDGMCDISNDHIKLWNANPACNLPIE